MNGKGGETVSKNGSREERAHLRELAIKTLEAYRNLNAVAANAAYAGGAGNGDGLARASELLESVLSELKGATKISS